MDPVSVYIRTLNESLKLRKLGKEAEEGVLLDKLDSIWNSLDENQRERANSVVASLKNYNS